MITVWKYVIDPGDGEKVFDVPLDAEWLGVVPEQRFGGYPEVAVYAQVDTEMAKEAVTLVVTGTGHPVTDDLHYIGSTRCGPFVWHAWCRGDRR